DGLVSVSRDQKVLAVGGSGGRGRVAHLGGPVGCRQFGKDYGHDGLFQNPAYLLPWRIGKQHGALLLRLCQSPCQRTWKVDGVGIGKKQPVPGRDLSAS